MPSGSKPSKPKPADVAADTKKNYIPLIKKQYGNIWNTHSYLFTEPLAQLTFTDHERCTGSPEFFVLSGDPVDTALNWAAQNDISVAFICSANDKRPGGDWETGVVGYEERLCRRSTLSAALATPGPGSYVSDNYPIPSEGGIFSESVVVFRGPHDKYEKLPYEEWRALPVCSVPPVRWPKLQPNGKKYSFAEERQLVKNKIRAAISICLYKGYTNVIVGDFGLSNSYRNPPLELAELWREVFLWDPELRGRIRAVAFVFEDKAQSTDRLIMEDLSKKNKHGSSSTSSSSKGKSKASSSHHSSSSSSSSSASTTDYQIFTQVFHPDEVRRVMSQPDPRCELGNLMAQ